MGQLADHYPAQQAGLKSGDKIVQVGQYKTKSFDDIQSGKRNKIKDNKTTIKFERDNQTKTVDITPKSKLLSKLN